MIMPPINRREKLPIDIQYLEWHIICRLTYSMSIDINTMYVDQHIVCQLTYCMSIEIHQCMYADRHTVCWLTYSISIDIHGVYVDRHTVCQSTYYMSIEILYVDTVVPNWLRFIAIMKLSCDKNGHILLIYSLKKWRHHLFRTILAKYTCTNPFWQNDCSSIPNSHYKWHRFKTSCVYIVARHPSFVPSVCSNYISFKVTPHFIYSIHRLWRTIIVVFLSQPDGPS